MHIGAAVPVIVGGRQPQTDLVFDHMRRRIDLDVQGSPQRDTHSRAVGSSGTLIMHDDALLRLGSKLLLHLSVSAPDERLERGRNRLDHSVFTPPLLTKHAT